MDVRQGDYKEDCYHALTREVGKEPAVVHSPAQHVRARSPVSRFHVRSSSRYVKLVLCCNPKSISHDYFDAITRKTLFPMRFSPCKRETRLTTIFAIREVTVRTRTSKLYARILLPDSFYTTARKYSY